MMHFVYEQSFVHPVSTNLSLRNCKKNWFLSANLAPEIGFHSPGKESRFFGLFWDQNVILVLIVLGSAIKYRRFDVILHFRHQYRSAVHQ